MKRIFFTLASFIFLLGLTVVPARAATVWCANCSEAWTQQIERVTNLEQLKQLISSYEEAVVQTQQQIQLVQNNLQQYANMIQNTINLPENMLGVVKGQFNQLAQLTRKLNLQKGDYLALGQVFDDIYPRLEILKNITSGAGVREVKDVWEKWSTEVDRAAQATFQLTGNQLQDLAENSEALDRHIGDLLSTPEGQMQALQSGNSLAAIQIDELRRLRALMAANIQAATQAMMKGEKREQLSVEQREYLLDKSGLASQYQGYK